MQQSYNYNYRQHMLLQQSFHTTPLPGNNSQESLAWHQGYHLISNTAMEMLFLQHHPASSSNQCQQSVSSGSNMLLLFNTLHTKFYTDFRCWARSTIVTKPHHKPLADRLATICQQRGLCYKTFLEHHMTLFLNQHCSQRQHNHLHVQLLLRSIQDHTSLTPVVKEVLSRLAMNYCVHLNSKQMLKRFVIYLLTQLQNLESGKIICATSPSLRRRTVQNSVQHHQHQPGVSLAATAGPSVPTASSSAGGVSHHHNIPPAAALSFQQHLNNQGHPTRPEGQPLPVHFGYNMAPAFHTGGVVYQPTGIHPYNHQLYPGYPAHAYNYPGCPAFCCIHRAPLPPPAPYPGFLLHFLSMLDTPQMPPIPVRPSTSASNMDSLLQLAAQIGDQKPKGMTRSELESLPTYRYSQQSASDQTSCVVCMCDFESRQMLRALSCGHEFHGRCVDRWLRHNRTCPICRADALNGKQSTPQQQ